MPDNLIYCGVLIIASKLYANSVLAVYVTQFRSVSPVSLEPNSTR